MNEKKSEGGVAVVMCVVGVVLMVIGGQGDSKVPGGIGAFLLLGGGFAFVVGRASG